MRLLFSLVLIGLAGCATTPLKKQLVECVAYDDPVTYFGLITEPGQEVVVKEIGRGTYEICLSTPNSKDKTKYVKGLAQGTHLVCSVTDIEPLPPIFDTK